jgi:hypothetical protein
MMSTRSIMSDPEKPNACSMNGSKLPINIFSGPCLKPYLTITTCGHQGEKSIQANILISLEINISIKHKTNARLTI